MSLYSVANLINGIHTRFRQYHSVKRYDIYSTYINLLCQQVVDFELIRSDGENQVDAALTHNFVDLEASIKNGCDKSQYPLFIANT